MTSTTLRGGPAETLRAASTTPDLGNTRTEAGEGATMSDATLDRVFAASDYRYFYDTALTAERTALDVTRVEQHLGLPPGAHILDIGCGYGRIANGLAARGYRVTGVDRSAVFLAQAQQDALERRLSTDRIQYVLADFRTWLSECPVGSDGADAAVLWANTWGYFSDDENAAVLRGVARVLRPGGVVLIEMPNLILCLHQSLEPINVTRRGNDIMLDQWTYDPVTGRVSVVRDMLWVGQRSRHVTFSERLYTFLELREVLLHAGFTAITASDSDGNPFQVASDRLVVRACVPEGE